MRKALIVVDVQNDFVSGSLAVEDGRRVAEQIAHYIQRADYDVVIATMDWHVDPGDHWSKEPDFVNSWPLHCQAYSWGAEWHPALEASMFDEVFLKGAYSAAYSGFEGFAAGEDGPIPEPLLGYLVENGVTDVDVCGIATDYCIKATVLDARRHGFNTMILLPLCAAVTPEGGAKAVAEMVAAGAVVVNYQAEVVHASP